MSMKCAKQDPQCGACKFNDFFSTTPQDLIDAGLYDEMAIAMQPGEHRDVGRHVEYVPSE